MTALSLPLFSFGYYSRWSASIGRRLPAPQAGGRDNSRLAFVLLSGFSLVLIFLLTQQAGGLIPFLLLGYRSSEETFGRGYLAIGFPWLFVSTLFLLARYARYRRRLDALLFALALAATLGMQLLQGNRSVLVYVGIVVLVFVHYAVKPLRWYVLGPLAITVFLALNLVGLMRGSDYESFDDLYERSAGVAERSGHGEDNMFYTLTIGEFVVPFETLPQMVRTVGISDTPWYGVSVLRTPLYLIPGAIFPDRPLPLANWYMRRFYGGGYGLNEGRAFFFLAEGYLNFMFAGVVLVALLGGFGWGALHRWMLSNAGNPFVVMIYALAVGFIFRAIAGDVSTILIGMTQQSLVAAVLGLAITGARWRLPRPRLAAQSSLA
jgi:hypothetical protein